MVVLNRENSLTHYIGYVQSLDTWTLTFPEIPEEVTSLARDICRRQPPSAEVIAANDLKIAEVSLENKRLYSSLVDSLCELAESGETLHWLHYNMSLTMLCFLTRWDVPLPPRQCSIPHSFWCFFITLTLYLPRPNFPLILENRY